MVTDTFSEQRTKWGNTIQEARKRKGYTQEDLARAWNSTLSYVQKIENGAKGNEDTYRELMALLRSLPNKQKAS